MKETAFADAFPKELGSQVEAALSALKLSSNYEHRCFSINVLGEGLLIPERVPSPSLKPDMSGLSLQQRHIACCMLTRSTDGFERHASLKEILQVNEPWSIPFVIALVGDYVIEILDEILKESHRMNRELVADFIRENPIYYDTVRSRVTSYWNCYYRRRYQRIDYVGFKILSELDAMSEG